MGAGGRRPWGGGVGWLGGGRGGAGGGEAEAAGRRPREKGKGEESSRPRAAAAAAVPLGEIPRAARGLWDRRPGLGEGFAVPRAARSRGPSWGVEARIRSAVGLAALPRAATAAVRPWPPPLPVRGRAVGGPSRGPAPAPRRRSRPPLPCRGGSRRGRVARGAAPRGCVPRRRPAGRRGVARRCALPPGLRPRRTACPEPALSRCLGGCWFSAGGLCGWRRAAPSAGPGPGPRWERAGRVGRVWGEAGCVAWGEKGRRSGATAALGPPPRPRPLPPLAPPPRAARRGSPSGVVARRRVPRLGPCPAPRSSPPPPPSNPGRAPACAAGPCSRLPARRSAVSVPRARTLPSPSPLPSRLSPLPRSRSLSPSLPRGGFGGKGVCWCVGGGVVGRGAGGSGVVGVFCVVGCRPENRAGADRGLFPGAGVPVLSSPLRPGLAGLLLARALARASLRDATSDQTWRPAEFKHISQRRKRN